MCILVPAALFLYLVMVPYLLQLAAVKYSAKSVILDKYYI